MTPILVNASAVVVAQNFNPPIISQIWLDRHGIVPECAFRPGTIFTDMLVRVQADEFQLLVTPDQCQFTPKGERDAQSIVVEKLGAIVRLLPHTPFRGLGLNFSWHLRADEPEVRALSRKLFYVENGPLHQMFQDDGARFGGYLSKDSHGFRLKLDVKPASGEINGETVHFLQFAFNYHADIYNHTDPAGAIEGLLSKWNEVCKESSLIASRATEGAK